MRSKSVVCLTIILLFTTLITHAAPAAQSSTPITIENAASLAPVATLTGHTGPVFSLAFSPDSSTLASGGSADDHTIRLWDVATATQRLLLEGHAAQIAAVGFNADGTRALTASYDSTIKVWDSATGALIDTLSQTDNTANETLVIGDLNTFFGLNGARLAYGGLYVFDLATHHETNLGDTSAELFESYGSMAISADSKTVAVLTSDGSIHIFDVDSAAETQTLALEDFSEYGGVLAFCTEDSSLLAVSNYDTSDIQIWNLETGELVSTLTGHLTDEDGTLTVNSLAFSPDSTLLASASYDNTVRLWDVFTGDELVSLDSPNGPAVVVFSPDGTHLAASDASGGIQLWSVPAS